MDSKLSCNFNMWKVKMLKLNVGTQLQFSKPFWIQKDGDLVVNQQVKVTRKINKLKTNLESKVISS